MTAEPTSAGQMSVRLRFESGRTLIELLIAMVLSLMIIGAVGALYSFTSQSARTSQQVGTLEERGKLAMHFLSEPIALAGYGNINSGELGGAVRTAVLTFKGPHLRACTNGRFQDPAALDFTCVPSVPGDPPGDQLHIGYQAEAVNAAPQGVNGQPMSDCLGQGAPPVVFAGIPVPTVYNLFSVEFTGSGALEFGCTGSGNAARQGLIRDVDDFKVYFALDTRGHLIGETGTQLKSAIPSGLMTATQVNALPGSTEPPDSLGNPWNHVVAVYVCVQLHSTDTGLNPDGKSIFQPCPADQVEAATGAPQLTIVDGVARRSFMQVFTIRSRAQAHAGSQG
jgi:hypothetical protein